MCRSAFYLGLVWLLPRSSVGFLVMGISDMRSSGSSAVVLSGVDMLVYHPRTMYRVALLQGDTAGVEMAHPMELAIGANP